MKALILADLHVKIDLDDTWAIKKYEELFTMIVTTFYQQKCSLLILAGDIFESHKINYKESQAFAEFLNLLGTNKILTYICSGNHDYVKKTDSVLYSFLPLVEHLPTVRIKEYGRIGDTPLFICGHNYLDKLLEDISTASIPKLPILVTHVRGNLNEYVKEEIDIEKVLTYFPKIIAGDIHSPIELYNGGLIYTDSPTGLRPSSPRGYNGILLDLTTFEHTRILLPKIPERIKIELAADAEMPFLSPEDKYTIISTGTPEQLSKLESNGNITFKKIAVVPETDLEVNLEISGDALDYLPVYLRTVDNLSETEVVNMMLLLRSLDNDRIIPQ